MNNLRKRDNDKFEKNQNNIKKRNIFGINTERRQIKNYKIFERKDDQNLRGYINDSHDYIMHHSINNNGKTPFNKLIKNDIFSASNFSVNDSVDKNKNIIIGKGVKKKSKTSPLNNYSNISNSQSNNQNLNHTSTTFSIGQGKKENLKISQNKNKEKKKNDKNYQYESGKNEIFRDNQEKNTTISNRISLQSLNDSKMMELASHYCYEDSSSENYQMNNIIHHKKKFLKKNN